MVTRRPKKQHGFTIVELLIVVVIIAVLAAITVVAYNGIQQRAQDSRVRSAAQQVAKATQAWFLTSGKTSTLGGSGSTSYTNGVCVGGNGGWFSRAVASYACTMDRVLVDAGSIPADLTTTIPALNKKYPGSAYAEFMLYACSTKGWVFMYALNTPDDKEITNIRTVCGGSPTATFGPIDTYGMNGGIIFTIPS